MKALNFGARVAVEAAAYVPRFGLLVTLRVCVLLMNDEDEGDELEWFRLFMRVSPLDEADAQPMIDHWQQRYGFVVDTTTVREN